MSMIQPSRFLRNALLLDAAASAATGLLLAAAAGPLAALFGLPAGFLRGAGLLLLPCALAFFVMAGRERLPRWSVQAVIGLNLLWIADSIALLLLGWFQPTGLGVAFVLAQAGALAVVTELELIGLKRSTRLEAAGVVA